MDTLERRQQSFLISAISLPRRDACTSKENGQRSEQRNSRTDITFLPAMAASYRYLTRFDSHLQNCHEKICYVYDHGSKGTSGESPLEQASIVRASSTVLARRNTELQMQTSQLRGEVELLKSLVNKCLLPLLDATRSYTQCLSSLNKYCKLALDQTMESLDSIPRPRNELEPIQSMELEDRHPPPPQNIDWTIHAQGGTTSTLELQYSAIQKEKPHLPMEYVNIELTARIHRLKHEIEYYACLVSDVLNPAFGLLRLYCEDFRDLLLQCDTAIQANLLPRPASSVYSSLTATPTECRNSAIPAPSPPSSPPQAKRTSVGSTNTRSSNSSCLHSQYTELSLPCSPDSPDTGLSDVSGPRSEDTEASESPFHLDSFLDEQLAKQAAYDLKRSDLFDRRLHHFRVALKAAIQLEDKLYEFCDNAERTMEAAANAWISSITPPPTFF